METAPRTTDCNDKSQSRSLQRTEWFGSFIQLFTQTSKSLRPSEISGMVIKVKQKMFSFCGCEKGDAHVHMAILTDTVFCNITRWERFTQITQN